MWEASVPLPEGTEPGATELICRAVDENYNTQPENAEALWNLRGILNNSWHRVGVNLRGEV